MRIISVSPMYNSHIKKGRELLLLPLFTPLPAPKMFKRGTLFHAVSPLSWPFNFLNCFLPGYSIYRTIFIAFVMFRTKCYLRSDIPLK